MDMNTIIAIVAGLFALIIIIGFIAYRRRAKVGVEIPGGGKLDFELQMTPLHPRPANHAKHQ